MPPSVACRQTDGAMMCYNAHMKPIATNIADFETLRKEGLLYVDKTAYLHRLITKPGSTFFFCARPRRFGKSLSVTTLKSIFLGHREFFDGLAIAKTDYDWKPHAVVHFNWGGVEVSDLATFEETFVKAVSRSLAEAGWTYDETLRPSDNLRDAIDFFYRRDGVGPAILIDEYDDPVAKALADVDLAEKIRTRLSAIYAQFKDNSGKIRFLYITGVSKFTKLSVFSTLSSLNDISFETDYAALYGYTEEELDANFEGHLRAKAERMGLTYEAFRAELKRWFNGYRFARYDATTVYNPVSIALTLSSADPAFTATWTSTGRASTLMNYIKREGALSIDPDRATFAGEADFDVADLKYHKVVILSDADQDGLHIRAILLTFFFRYMRELINEGHVYIGLPPLYKIEKRGQIEYAYDDAALDELKKKFGKGAEIQRYKGLGEMNAEQLWTTTMDPKNRKLVRVTIDDAAQAEKLVSVLMGDAIELRRNYIVEHADFNKEDAFIENVKG